MTKMTKHVYTTGAYLSPLQGRDGRWYWAVSFFNEDTFKDGEFVDLEVVSDTKEGMVIPDEE